MEFSPYHSALTTPLLSFGGEKWTIGDAVEATAIWGSPGSGKSSGSARALAMAYLQAGMGGLVLCAKNTEADTWRDYARDAGRAADLIVVDETGAHCFNILDYAATHLADRGFEHNLVALMRRMSEAARAADSSSASGENRYFTDSALLWVSHAFPLLLLAYGTLRLSDLDRFITSAPLTLAQVPKSFAAVTASDLADDEFSFCIKTHILAAATYEKYAAAAQNADNEAQRQELIDQRDHALRLITEHGDFFLETFPSLESKARSGVQSTLASLIYPFLSGKLAQLFCTKTTFSPHMCREGKIIILDIPTLRYQEAGAVAQTLVKYIFGIAAQNDHVTPDTRPIFVFADEAQNFLNKSDADLLATARSSKICVTYITQDLPTYYDKLGSTARDTVESILSKFGTRIFHANTSRETNLAASEIIGKVKKYHITKTATRGKSSGVGGNQHDAGGGFNRQGGANTSYGESSGMTMEYQIPPDYFATSLRTGTKKNGFMVDAIVVRTAKNWKKTGRHWVKAGFCQK